MQIIEQIEQLSAVTTPTVEVYPLKNVDSRALGALLTRLYQQVLGPRIGDVSITPLVKPNALLLVGRPENVRMAIELIQRLDVPVLPATRFEVFPLKNASAAERQDDDRPVPRADRAPRQQQQPAGDRRDTDAGAAGDGRGRRADQFADRQRRAARPGGDRHAWWRGSIRRAARPWTRCACFRCATPWPPKWRPCCAARFKGNGQRDHDGRRKRRQQPRHERPALGRRRWSFAASATTRSRRSSRAC